LSRLSRRIPDGVHDALNLVIAVPASKYLSLVPQVSEIVVGIRASR
jgi:hypothetical protein